MPDSWEDTKRAAQTVFGKDFAGEIEQIRQGFSNQIFIIAQYTKEDLDRERDNLRDNLTDLEGRLEYGIVFRCDEDGNEYPYPATPSEIVAEWLREHAGEDYSYYLRGVANKDDLRGWGAGEPQRFADKYSCAYIISTGHTA